MGCGASRKAAYVALQSEAEPAPAGGGLQIPPVPEEGIEEEETLPALHACICLDPSCEELGRKLSEALWKQLRLSPLRRRYGEIEVSTSLLLQGVWSVPQCQAFILLLTPEWLLTPLGVAALRATFRLRSMQLGPELLPVVHVNAFPDGPSSALNAPSGQLLREAATPGSWGCLDSHLAAAVDQAAAWVAGRLEAIFAPRGEPGEEDATPIGRADRHEGSGLTQTTWRRERHARPREPVEAVWQDHPEEPQKSPKRPANMPSLRNPGTRVGEEHKADKPSLRQVAETTARHLDDLHLRETAKKFPRRASEPTLTARSRGGAPSVVKDWADAMRDVLGVPDASGAFPQGSSRHSSRHGSKEAPPPGPPGAPSQPVASSRKDQLIPPLPERPIRLASGLAQGGCRRHWRVQELTLDESFEDELPPSLQAAATVRHWAALALEKRPRTPGRDPDELNTAPATPHGREQGWDHFGLLSTGFYLAEAMSPSAMRGIGVGMAAPDPFTGGAALSFEKSEEVDPTASWWGTHPAETQAGTGFFRGKKENDRLPGETTARSSSPSAPNVERNPASKVDAMVSLQVDLPPLPDGAPLDSRTQSVEETEKKNFEMSFCSLELVAPLIPAKGGGGYGAKFIALDAKLTRRVVCWRFVAPKHLEAGPRALLQDAVAKDVQQLQLLRHPCLCPYFGAEMVGKELCVVTGYASGGSVADWLADAGPVPEAPCLRVVQSVLQGLEFLHRHMVTHGALRGGNVLLGPGSAIRLGDFGLAALRQTGASAAPLGAAGGLPPTGASAAALGALAQSGAPWMSPEVLEGNKPTAPSDIWSLGCLIAECALGRPIALGAAFRASSQASTPLLAPLLKQELEALPESSRDYVAKCMRHKASERPHASDILEGW